ncbi:2-succinyl-5-enolpyruvyl-6-hydroxy-3-cyclohexene-1-carboxylic-acid synthase [Homoserinimonas sp. A447]
MAGGPTEGSSAATDFSVTLLAEFLRLGVRDVVLSPGSRSQALALAAAEFEKAGRLRLHVRIDERVAGFLALGLAVESGLPVAVITTSGTAVANLHPAVLEAHHSGVPLILLTADRPAELRGIGSNQTTQQHGLFGTGIRFIRDIEAPSYGGHDRDNVAELVRETVAAAMGHSGPRGPVHLNLAFREPLSGVVGPLPPAAPSPSAEVPVPERSAPRNSHYSPERALSRVAAAPHTVVIAGHAAGEQAEAAARALGAPLLAEVSSGARFGPNLVVAYRELLNDPDFGGRIERVIVFGHPTLTREVPVLVARPGVEAIVVLSRGADAYNPGHAVGTFTGAVEISGEPDQDRSWVGSWVHASRAIVEAGDDSLRVDAPDAVDGSVTPEFQRQTLAALRAPVTRRSLARSVWQASWPHDRLVLAASRLIRELDRVAPGKKITVHANRGLAGIDGTIATAVGIALARQDDPSAGVTRVLVGDLALLHDVGALHFGAGEPRPRMQVIVGNDGGGTIFDELEVAETAPADSFDRVLYTQHTADLSAIAAAYGWRYLRVSNRSDLDQALTASDGQVLIEVPLPRD